MDGILNNHDDYDFYSKNLMCRGEKNMNSMDNNNIINQDEWTFLLFLLFMQDWQNKNKTWEQFENDLIYKNRFSSDSPIIHELKKRSEQASKIIPAKTVLFRARSFKRSSFDKLLRYYMQENNCSKDEIDDVLKNWTETEKHLALLPQLYSDVDPNYLNNNEGTVALVSAQRKWKKNVKFKGYNAIDSGAPESDLVGNGRANPDHIRYLYLCEDNVTPVYEIRPIIGEQVSIAKFILQKDIKVYDLTLDIQDHIKDPEYDWPSLYNTIGQMFSKPYNGEAKQYIPTQFLAEKIKQMGFDGLRFNSSLHKGGVNVVLFNPNLCKAISSELVDVTDIKLSIAEPIIYKIGKKDPGE